MNEANEDGIALRRELATRLGMVLEEDYCRLTQIKETTAAAHRKRGIAPPYVQGGNTFLYPVETLAEHLRSKVRARVPVSLRDTL